MLTIVLKPPRQVLWQNYISITANTVQCFLKITGLNLVMPNRATPYLSTLANKQISFF